MPGEPARLPRVLGIGGSLRPGSRSETVLASALDGARAAGAETELWSVSANPLGFYVPGAPICTEAERLVKAVQHCDALLVSTPAYHGTLSAPVKNVLDHLDVLRDGPRPYLAGKVVGIMSVGDGTVAAVQAAATLVQVAHALRAFVTPLQVIVTDAEQVIPDDRVQAPEVAARLATLGQLVVASVQLLDDRF